MILGDHHTTENKYISCFVPIENKNLYFREIVLDDLLIGEDPDCAESNGKKKCYPKQTIKPESVHIHPEWIPGRPTVGLTSQLMSRAMSIYDIHADRRGVIQNNISRIGR